MKEKSKQLKELKYVNRYRWIGYLYNCLYLLSTVLIGIVLYFITKLSMKEILAQRAVVFNFVNNNTLYLAETVDNPAAFENMHVSLASCGIVIFQSGMIIVMLITLGILLSFIIDDIIKKICHVKKEIEKETIRKIIDNTCKSAVFKLSKFLLIIIFLISSVYQSYAYLNNQVILDKLKDPSIKELAITHTIDAKVTVSRIDNHITPLFKISKFQLKQLFNNTNGLSIDKAIVFGDEWIKLKEDDSYVYFIQQNDN